MHLVCMVSLLETVCVSGRMSFWYILCLQALRVKLVWSTGREFVWHAGLYIDIWGN